MSTRASNIRASNIASPDAILAAIMHLDSDPCNAGSIVAVRNADVLTLSTRDILINSKGQEITITSHSLLSSFADLHILGIIGVHLGDLATLLLIASVLRGNHMMSQRLPKCSRRLCQHQL
jgi:hypothetical protein